MEELWWKKPQPVAIGSIVEKVLKDKSLITKNENERINEIWKMVADQETLCHTKIDRFYKNKLYITVDSSAYFFEFKNFYKKSILDKLKNYCNEIYVSDILLQVGDIGSE